MSTQRLKVSELFGPAGYWEYETSDGVATPSFISRFGVTQGEGRYVGRRSVFLRMFGCNLKCPSFGLTHGEKTNEPQTIAQNLHLYKKVSELPPAKYGCDSYYSVYPEFKSLSPTIPIDVLAAQILQCGGGSFFGDRPHSPIHLIFTGGEPLLPGWQRVYVDLIAELRRQDPVWSEQTWLKLPVTFETNGTQPLVQIPDSPVRRIDAMAASCNVTWSVSPKLTGSGHTHDETIFPEVLRSYSELRNSEMYLKFVVANVSELDEVDAVVRQYEDAGVKVPVYIMPEGGSPDEYRRHATLELVSESVRRGYDISPRLHVMIGDNAMSW